MPEREKADLLHAGNLLISRLVCDLKGSSWHFSDMAALADDVRCRGDSVAKVVLRKVSKILRAAGAVFV